MDFLQLADYREAVARLYLSPVELTEFRRRRDDLSAHHPQSPVPPADRASFTGLRYYPSADDAVVEARLREQPGRLEIDSRPPMVELVAHMWTWFLLISAVQRMLIFMHRGDYRAERGDAKALRDATLLPAHLWGAILLLGTIAALTYGGAMLLRLTD